MWLALIGGWWIGLGSSGHCLGMCGPIAMALPFRNEHGRMNWGKYGFYQFGRILTYISIGLIVGFFGRAITWQGFGNWLSILAGSLLILMALNYSGLKSVSNTGFYRNLSGWISSVWKRTFESGHAIAFISAGAANGLLPCGMVYAAAIGALGMGNTLDSISMMAGFGLGTLPIFILLPSFSKLISRYPIIWRYFIPIALGLTGVWLILRGMPSLFVADHCPDMILQTPMCVSGE